MAVINQNNKNDNIATTTVAAINEGKNNKYRPCEESLFDKCKSMKASDYLKYFPVS